MRAEVLSEAWQLVHAAVGDWILRGNTHTGVNQAAAAASGCKSARQSGEEAERFRKLSSSAPGTGQRGNCAQLRSAEAGNRFPKAKAQTAAHSCHERGV